MNDNGFKAAISRPDQPLRPGPVNRRPRKPDFLAVDQPIVPAGAQRLIRTAGFRGTAGPASKNPRGWRL